MYNILISVIYNTRFRDLTRLRRKSSFWEEELKDLKPINSGESDLSRAMRLIINTGKGPKEQIPSMGCNIKWTK